MKQEDYMDNSKLEQQLISDLTEFQNYRLPDDLNKPIPPKEVIDPVNQILYNVEKNQNPLTETLYTATGSTADRYNDRYLGYTPYKDNEEIYANAKPFTLVDDALPKLWETFKSHMGSAYLNMYQGLNALADGNPEAYWDNDYTDSMATAMENIEHMFPHYQTADQRDNPLSFRNAGNTMKSFVPAIGTALGGIVDMFAGHVVASAVGSVGGPGGIAVANIARFAKDAKTLKNIFKASSTLAKQLATIQRTGNITSKAQMYLTSAFYASGEAAIQAKMGAAGYVEEETKKYFQQYGKMPNQETIDGFDKKANDIGRATFGLNLALITGSQVLQVPGLLKGKLNNDIFSQLPMKVVNGKVVSNLNYKTLLKETAKDSVTEGLEEFGQGVIDDATKSYYEGKDKIFLNEIIGSAFKRAGTTEGQLEFLGGAFVGGLMNVGGQAVQYRNTKNNIDAISGQYNESTKILFENYKNVVKNLDNIETAQKAKDAFKADHAFSEGIFNMALSDVQNKTTLARQDYLQSLKGMDTSEFNDMLNSDVKEVKQSAVVSGLEATYNEAVDIIEGLETAFQINPFVNKNWYQRGITKLGDLTPFNFKSKEDISNKVWRDLKYITAKNIFNAVEMDKRSEILDEILLESIIPLVDAQEVALLLNADPKQAVKDWKRRVSHFKDTVPEIAAALEKIKGLTDVEQYEALLDIYKFKDKKRIALYKDVIKTKIARNMFVDKANDLQTPAGQKREAMKIIDYLEVIERSERVPKEERNEVKDESVIEQSPEEVIKEPENKKKVESNIISAPENKVYQTKDYIFREYKETGELIEIEKAIHIDTKAIKSIKINKNQLRDPIDPPNLDNVVLYEKIGINTDNVETLKSNKNNVSLYLEEQGENTSYGRDTLFEMIENKIIEIIC